MLETAILRLPQEDVERVLQQAREDERRRIARDLHDDVSQQLALLAITVDRLRQQTALSDPGVSRSLDGILARAQEIGSSLRRVSHELHASKPGDLGFAVRALAHEIAAQYAIDIHVACEHMPPSVPAAPALVLFRIVQEALQNVVKHSGARCATVDMTSRSEIVFLSIADDGCGFDPEAPPAGGLGLASMRERLDLLGGTLSITSAPSQGTCIAISVRLPMASTTTAPRARRERVAGDQRGETPRAEHRHAQHSS